MKQLILIVVTITYIHALSAQISEGGQPISLNTGLSLKAVSFHTMPAVNTKEMLEDDLRTESNGVAPYRFAYVFEVAYSPKNAGEWSVLPNGDKIWRLGVESPGAYALTTVFENFRIPPGAKLFLYNPDNGKHLGAFTQRNNTKSGVFPTAPLAGDKMIIEYFEPQNASFTANFTLKNVGHDYRGVLNNGPSNPLKEESAPVEPCEIEINCPEAAAWQIEKRAVCRIFFVDGINGGLCSGALVNNTRQDGRLYFLTANHCLSTEAVANTVVFLFNFEHSTCAGTDAAELQTMSGSTLRATHTDSDFTLLELDGPVIPFEYEPFFACWDRRDLVPTSSTGIHHPEGRPKQIAIDDDAASDASTHWDIDPDHGELNHGSSGSPLFDQNHRVVGQLHWGHEVWCVEGAIRGYGKFAYSWETHASNAEQLRFWLDPLGIGGNPNTLDGNDITKPICVPFHNIVTLLDLSRKYEASNFITASNVISNGSATGIGVIYDAGNEIRLQTGFHAQPGCFFLATIDGCGGNVRPGKERNIQANQQRNDLKVSVSPNPFQDLLTVQFERSKPGPVSISLTDALGRLVAQPYVQQPFDAGQQSIQMEFGHLPPGLYYISLSTSEGRSAQKVVKGD